MATITMSLQEKVRSIIMQDDIGEGPIGIAGSEPHDRGFIETDCEAEMRVWGCVYGIAFGLARSEEPCEPIKAVGERAYLAAWPVFQEYNRGKIDVSDAVRAVYHGAPA